MNLVNFFKHIYKNLEENKALLNDLDQAIGDGDHGTNICRGFGEIINNPEKLNDDFKKIFNYCGITLIMHVGGSSGPLIGTFFMKLADAIDDGLGCHKWLFGLKSGLEGIKARGKSTVGEKTIIDSLDSAIKNIEKNEPNSMSEFFKYAYEGAKEGAIKTISLVATKGRASYLKQRSLNHMDPGAKSCEIILKSVYEEINND